MNRTSFFGRLGALLAAPLAKALAPTSDRAMVLGRYVPGVAGTVRLGAMPTQMTAVELAPYTVRTTYIGAEGVGRIEAAAAEFTHDGTRWLPPANTLP